jgi:stage II sporulation protein AA (anti-sigma F factor antagonist)
MELRIEERDAVTIVHAAGDVGADSSGELQIALEGLIDSGQRRVVLDLEGVRYVSSAGLRVFLIVAKRLAGNGAFALCRATEPVRQVLDMTGFSNLIKVEGDFEAAVAAVAG